MKYTYLRLRNYSDLYVRADTEIPFNFFPPSILAAEPWTYSNRPSINSLDDLLRSNFKWLTGSALFQSPPDNGLVPGQIILFACSAFESKNPVCHEQLYQTCSFPFDLTLCFVLLSPHFVSANKIFTSSSLLSETCASYLIQYYGYISHI